VPQKKKTGASHEQPTGAPDWSSKSARVRWLLDTRFQGNRSAFAKAVGFSHTIVARVVGGQDPGQRLMTAIVERLGVNSDWLMIGVGQPFAKPVDAAQAGLPLVRVPLPGHPMDHQNVWEGLVPDPVGPMTVASRYWLELAPGQPLVESGTPGFLPGDRLLMETDRARFTRNQDLDNRLCVIRTRTDGKIRLGKVEYVPAGDVDDPERLEVEYFKATPDASDAVQEHAYRHHPDGRIEFKFRTLHRGHVGGREKLVPAWQLEDHFGGLRVELTDIVAVWLDILFRPAGMRG
jgi:hypothetical protein